MKAPRRVLYFSDGTLEEYSTDDEQDDMCRTHAETSQLVKASELSWIGWFGYQMITTSSRALAVCDYLGENIAYYLGITAPKYQYELEEHQRCLKEEEEERRQAAEETQGWGHDTSTLATPSTLTPPPSLPQSYKMSSLLSQAEASLQEEATTEAPYDDLPRY
ncbi:protein FAM177A1 [Hyalella azteca]|uniref:Protein FAM177A1 n=1 Tax=Hyalella azteca TaxID=294128 RepID=A0A8B7NEJ8_HYAAZ|nr:protein FAM177A1 [Hyalella azteca]